MVSLPGVRVTNTTLREKLASFRPGRASNTILTGAGCGATACAHAAGTQPAHHSTSAVRVSNAPFASVARGSRGSGAAAAIGAANAGHARPAATGSAAVVERVEMAAAGCIAAHYQVIYAHE